jgi:hypothetical protein
MRLFQNSGLYLTYLRYFDQCHGVNQGFSERLAAFLDDRFGAPHFLLPVLEGHPDAFFTNGDDEVLQRSWARENGLPHAVSLDDILLAQIEHHRTEVFYNLDPMRAGSGFVRKLPGCVKKSIGWRAAPSPGADFSDYDMVVCNFPSILESYRQRGWRAEYFTPAHDPEMDDYAANTDRPIDVLFVGGYSRHHRRRAEVLEAVAAQCKGMNLVFHLDRSRLTRLAESPLGRLLPLSEHRRPPDIRAVTAEPVFGRDLYKALSKAKIVLNGAIDMAGTDRGNMRCFEALGCGALMISDQGRYPVGFVNGETMRTYHSAEEVTALVIQTLENWGRDKEVAQNGRDMVKNQYSKAVQWERFLGLLK